MNIPSVSSQKGAPFKGPSSLGSTPLSLTRCSLAPPPPACPLQIRLYEDRPQRLLWPGEELYEVGLAYMAEGCATYQPKHIRNALDIFGQLKSSAGSPGVLA